MKIKFTKKIKMKLEARGFATLAQGQNYINPSSLFELPCDVADVDLSFPLKMGAFSYVGKNFRNYSAISIGRFCSIAENVKIGLHSHPTDRFSTSPYFYAKNWKFKGGNTVLNGKAKVIPEYENLTDLMKVEIGDDCWIGANVCIRGGLKIGHGVIIATGAIVTKNIPDFEIWGGIPAKKIGTRKVQKEGFSKKYEPWETLNNFSEFLPIRKKLKNLFKK